MCNGYFVIVRFHLVNGIILNEMIPASLICIVSFFMYLGPLFFISVPRQLINIPFQKLWINHHLCYVAMS